MTAMVMHGRGPLLVLAFLAFASIQAYKTALPVEIQPDNQVAVNVGQSRTILCKVAVPLQFCRFVIPGEPSLVLSPNQPSEDGIDYFGEGIDRGHCGVKISSIKEKHDGNVTCYLTPTKGRTESFNSVRLIVARQPDNPQLRLNKIGHFKPGEKMEISCTAEGGRPPANVSLFLDDEPIGYDERPFLYGRMEDSNVASLNTSRSVTPNDHGKTLSCVASHLALAEPLRTQRTINVNFAPEPQQTIESFGKAIGRSGKVNVTVHANPKPNFTWKVGDEDIPAGQTDSTGRLQTSSAIDLGRGYWNVELTIDSVQKSDTEKMYALRADNGEGYANYNIILSSSSEPPAGVDLDAGSIIGIVIGVLLLILAVFLVVFARATGRWCFAACKPGQVKYPEKHQP
ncbi:fasciclin-3 isoform X2 [Copidosoma floridanum]|uniref:fasciclin-3 isoform X2 n=1 Tax=Copidosoma floridanum TaxID=29053 RepID=UPI000C6F5CD4|nr:fasciclin-3 isoform X2 [Copidosoma floridanum]